MVRSESLFRSVCTPFEPPAVNQLTTFRSLVAAYGPLVTTCTSRSLTRFLIVRHLSTVARRRGDNGRGACAECGGPGEPGQETARERDAHSFEYVSSLRSCSYASSNRCRCRHGT